MVFCVVFGGAYLVWLTWAEGWILAALLAGLTVVGVFGLAVHAVLAERNEE